MVTDSDEELEIWNCKTGKRVSFLEIGCSKFCFSPDGKVFVALRGKTVCFYRVEPERLVKSLTLRYYCNGVSWKPDGTMLALHNPVTKTWTVLPFTLTESSMSVTFSHPVDHKKDWKDYHLPEMQVKWRPWFAGHKYVRSADGKLCVVADNSTYGARLICIYVD